MLDGNDLPHDLLLAARQKRKLRNAFNNKNSTDLKLSKAQISKNNSIWRVLRSLLSKLVGPLMKKAIPLVQKCFSFMKINSSCLGD